MWAKPDTEFERKSGPAKIVHDLFVPGAGPLSRGANRLRNAPSTEVAAHGCGECRRWLRRRRSRTAALTVLTLCLLVAVPRTMVEMSQQGLAQVSLIAGVVLIVVTASSARWFHEFARASVSIDGNALVITDAHPDYVREALALGAEKLPEPRVSA
mgnify:CR=1 FL=1